MPPKNQSSTKPGAVSAGAAAATALAAAASATGALAETPPAETTPVETPSVVTASPVVALTASAFADELAAAAGTAIDGIVGSKRAAMAAAVKRIVPVLDDAGKPTGETKEVDVAEAEVLAWAVRGETVTVVTTDGQKLVGAL